MKLFNKNKNNISFLFIFTIIISACTNFLAPVEPTPNFAVTEQMLALQQTQVVLDITVQAYQAGQTQAAMATSTPIPTATPLPSPTATPGPIVIQDDFSTNTGRWAECGQCVIQNGVLQMGPYPVSITGEAYTAICSECGLAQDYKMGVDATFVDGYTDRGFGLLLRELDGSYVDVEITTWQVYGIWSYDKAKNSWASYLTDGWGLTGTLRPGTATNRVEVEVTSSGGTSNVIIKINGELVKTISMPAVAGRVGLVVGLHSLGVSFDNFYFEGYPVQQPNQGLPGQNG